MSMRLDGCVKCGACVAACPVIDVAGSDEFPGPRHLAVELPRFPAEAITNDSIFRCTTCGICEESCPSKLAIPQAIMKIRSEKAGCALDDGRQRMIDNVDRYGRIVEPSSGLYINGRRGKVMYFPGCIGTERTPEVASTVVEVMNKVGINVMVPPAWVCCGSPLEKIGEEDRARKLMEVNLAAFGSPDTTVTSCPGCTVQLQKRYGLETVHFIEFLYEDIGLRRLKLKERKLKVALHQPCHLVRGVGPHTIDYAHAILSSVPGVKVVQIEDSSGCCGGGGGVAASFPELSRKMAESRIMNASAAGADVMIAPCPFCLVNLRKVGKMPVEDISTFVSNRMI